MDGFSYMTEAVVRGCSVKSSSEKFHKFDMNITVSDGLFYKVAG